MNGLRIAVTIAALVAAQGALAECKALRAKADAAQRWANPHPARDDRILEFRGTEIVFHPITLASNNMFDSNERSVYTMGASGEQLYETQLKVRIASSIKGGRPSRMQLLMGKYEISKAQYAIIMGKGSLREGLALLREHSRDPDLERPLAEYFEGDCAGVITRRLAQTLAQPISHLNYVRIAAFIRQANKSCIETPKCQSTLREISNNDLIPGFLRLPVEHEWEFVARGGEAFIKGEISREELQLDRPKQTAGRALLEHAHVGNDPDRVIPIGSKKPLFGVYDMLGNVQELMANPFTSENGFGAVGAFVARGGNFRLSPDELRVSKRVEVNKFILDQDRDEFRIQDFPTVGFRLVIGLPVAGGVARVGSNELETKFGQNYKPVDEGGAEQVGRNVHDPANLPPLDGGPVAIGFDISPTYDSGHVRAVLTGYGHLRIKTESGVPLQVTMSDMQGNELDQARIARGKRVSELGPALPGRYVVSMQSQSAPAGTIPISAAFEHAPADDTGEKFPNLQALASAKFLTFKGDEMPLQGYVGADDVSDNFPVRLGSAFDAVQLDLAAPRRRDVTVSLIDVKLNKYASTVLARGEGKLILPAEPGFRGFLQITAGAEANAYTDYKGTVKPVRATDSIFVSPGRNGAKMVPEREYSGILTGRQPALEARFTLSAPKKVRLDLSGLSGDVDMSIRNQRSGGARIEHDNVSGTESEIFVGDLEAGTYRVSLRRKSRADGFAAFDLTMRVLGDAKMGALTLSELRQRAQRQAKSLDPGSNSTVHTLSESITYFRVPMTYGRTYDFKVSAAAFDLDLFLETKTGQVVAKSVEAGSGETETLRYAPSPSDLSGGSEMYLRLESQDRSAGTIYASILARALQPAVKAAHWSDRATFTQTYEDWEVGRYESGKNSKRCVARTLARDVRPTIGWREQLPYFVVQVDPGDESIYVSIDDIRIEKLTYAGERATAEVHVGNNSYRRTLQLDGNWLKPLEPNGKYMDIETVSLFRKGTYVVVRGTTDDGEEVASTYSLRGYTAAIKNMNRLCRAQVLWMLGR